MNAIDSDSPSGAKVADQEANPTSPGSGLGEERSQAKTIPTGAMKGTTGELVKTDKLPTPEALAGIYEMPVQDKDGKEIRFGTLVKHEGTRRNVVVFVRHFFCGFCQEYIRALARAFPISALFALNPPTSLTIIGCGSPTLIKQYLAETSCPYPIYADPTRQIYQALELPVSLAASPKTPEYITVSFWGSTWSGIKQGLKAGLGARKSGKISQNGGELIWVDGELSFIHRMIDTTSHLEIKDLEKLLQ